MKNLPLAELPVYAYYRDIGRCGQLKPDVERQLAYWIQNGDQNALQKLVTANLKNATIFAKRYTGMGVTLEDLIAAANVGLIKAAKRYDPQVHGRFMQQASWWMRHEIEAQFARIGRSLSIPPNVYHNGRKTLKQVDRMEQKKGYPVSAGEASSELGMSIEEFEFLTGSVQQDISLDVPAEGVEDPGVTMLDMLVYEDDTSPDDQAVTSIFSQMLSYAMTNLNAREQDIIRLTYGIGIEQMTLEEAGRKMGISSQKAREIKKKALRKLRSMPVLQKFQ